MTNWLVDTPFVRAVGTTLIAFLWQGAVIGAIATGVLFGLRRASANARYLVGCLALGAMAAGPAISMFDTVSVGWAPPSAASSSASVVGRPAVGTVMEVEASSPELTSPVANGLPIVVLSWAVGVTALVARLLGGWIGILRVRRRAVALEGHGWSRKLGRLKSRLGIYRQVRLLESTLAVVPFVVGWLRPVIVLPTSAIAGLSPQQLDAILAHELIHVRRGDYLVNVLQCGIEILFFYHPAVWWISRQVRIEREHCCDDVAAELSGDGVTYAAALTSLELLRRHHQSLAMAANGGDLVVRVRRLVAPDSIATPRMSGGLVMGVLLTIVLLGLGGPLGRVTDSPQMVLALAMPRADLNLAQPVFEPSALAPPLVTPARTSPSRAAAPAVPATPQQPAADTSVRSVLLVTVEDEQHGVIPGAVILMTDPADSQTRRLITNVAGRAVFSDVRRSAYTLRVEGVPGMESSQGRVDVPEGQMGVLVVTLLLDGIQESVVVSEDEAVPSPAPAGGDVSTVATGIVSVASYRERWQEMEALSLGKRRILGILPFATNAPLPKPEWRPLDAAPVDSSPATPRAPVRVGGDVVSPRKVKDVKPIYPVAALTRGAEEEVWVMAAIAADGTVLGGVPFTVSGQFPSSLVQEASNAVRQWRFTPARLNGVPVPVSLMVTVKFVAK